MKPALRFINPRWPHREIYEYPPDPPETNPRCILIGDSITKYVCKLQETKCIFERGADMEDLGVITRLYEEELSYKEVVCYHGGTNNIWNFSLEQLIESQKELIKLVRSIKPDIKIMFSTILPRPCDEHCPEIVKKIAAYNKFLCVESKKGDIKVVRTNRHYLEHGRPIIHYYAKDGLHLNREGTEAITAELKQSINWYKQTEEEKNEKRARKKVEKELIPTG